MNLLKIKATTKSRSVANTIKSNVCASIINNPIFIGNSVNFNVRTIKILGIKHNINLYYKNVKVPTMNVKNQTLEIITINPDIVAYDEKTIEYVILHEFCHLKYKIRTKNFWKMIGTYMPNYEQYAVTLGNIAY